MPHRTRDACGLPTALAASSAADNCGCGRGEPPGTAMVGRTNDDPPDMVDRDAEWLSGGETLPACVIASISSANAGLSRLWRAQYDQVSTQRRV